MSSSFKPHDAQGPGSHGGGPERTISVVLDRRTIRKFLPEEARRNVTVTIGTIELPQADDATCPSTALLQPEQGISPAFSPQGCLRSTASLLDPLTGAELVRLRRAVTDGLRTGRPVLLCPRCREPVTVAVTSVARAGTLGGQRAFLKHRPGRRGAARCPLARGITTRPPGSVEAQRFDGAQEGRWHATTKAQIFAACLEEDGVGFVATEVRVPVQTPHGPSWRQADLLVRHETGTVAIEVQGARPLLATVAGREADLGGVGVGVLWVVDGRYPERLELQGFQDIHGTRDGVVHAWDGRTDAASRSAGALVLRRWLVAEHVNRLHVIEDRLVTLADAITETMMRLPKLTDAATKLVSGADTTMANAEQATKTPGPTAPVAMTPEPGITLPLYESRFAATLLDAVARGDDDAAKRAYELLAAPLGLPFTWQAARLDGLPYALGAMGTALTGRRGLPYDVAPEHWAATLNSFLLGSAAADWVPLLLEACKGHVPAQARLARTSTARKLADAQAQVARTPERSRELAQRWGTLLARVFPPDDLVPPA